MQASLTADKNPRRVAIAPDPSRPGSPFEDGLFGVNAEITRRGFFSGLSAEMLNNRKLFAGEDAPDGWVCEGFERVNDRPEESPCGSASVILENGSMRQQSQVIALQSGREYQSRIWVRPLSSAAEITFGVEGLEQAFPLQADGAPYRELSFDFMGEEIANGAFCIKADGQVQIFEASLLPKNHFHGMRRDVIECLKAIAPTSIRFPGGCSADHFHWREDLKAPEFRTPEDGSSKWFLFRDSYDQDTHDIGLNEFMLLCREVGAEPEYTVSLLLSDPEDARQLVEYCNGDANTEYGAIRQFLGYNAFDIKLWYVGNEAYFFGGETYQNSGAAAAERTGELVRAMLKADPNISIAIGLTWSEAFHQWSKDFLARVDFPYEYVSYHNYIGILADATQGLNGKATCEMLETNFIDGEDEGLNFYKYGLYGDKFDQVGVLVDEWNYAWGCDSNNGLFFSNALQFHFLAKSGEKYRIKRAEFFMPINEGMISVSGADSKLESTGELFRLMAPHRGGRIIPCACAAKELDLLCTDHGGTLYLSAVNRSAAPIELQAEGFVVEGCTQIQTGEYSFDSNEYAVAEEEAPVVSGHSVLFCTLKRMG